jgi:hypothetical protein
VIHCQSCLDSVAQARCVQWLLPGKAGCSSTPDGLLKDLRIHLKSLDFLTLSLAGVLMYTEASVFELSPSASRP